MGRLSAEAMLGEGIEVAVRWHMSSNIYPPAPFMTGVAMKAIEAIEDGEPRRLIDLPVGVTWKEQDAAPAAAIVESYRLDVFIEHPFD